MDERAIGGAGGDVGERVRGVRGIDEVALQHDVGDVAAQSDAMRGERAQDGLEIVDELGEGLVFERGAEAGGVEGGLDGGGAVDGEAKADRGQWRTCIPPIAIKLRWMGHPKVCCGRGEHVHRLGGGRLGVGVGVGVGGKFFGNCARLFGDGDGEAATLPTHRAKSCAMNGAPAVPCSLLPVPCPLRAMRRSRLRWDGG